MNDIIKHIPNWARDDRDPPPPKDTFTSLDELFAIPWVAAWAEEPNFHKWSHDDHHLIIERFGGRWWWVVGHMKEVPEGLPEWDRGIAAVWDANGRPLDLPGKDVHSYWGNTVTMNDGRRFKKRHMCAATSG